VIDTAAFASPIKRDEEIVFFPVAARLSADLGHWRTPSGAGARSAAWL
jgi:hypothetical protein